MSWITEKPDIWGFWIGYFTMFYYSGFVCRIAGFDSGLNFVFLILYPKCVTLIQDLVIWSKLYETVGTQVN